MKKKLFVFLICLLIPVFMLTGCSFTFGGKTYFRPLSYASLYQDAIDTSGCTNTSDIAEALLSACVTVVIYKNNEATASGSGVCIYSGGYIATNYHVISYVVASPSEYSIRIITNDSEIEIDSELLWYNVSLDVAVIQSANGDIPFVNMLDRTVAPSATNKLHVLEQVIAIGTPLELIYQNVCTTGTISKINTYAQGDNNVLYEDLIMHTAPINHGNSGGGLFDMNGMLIGLNTLGNESANSVFFAVPIYPVILALPKIVEQNEKLFPEKYTTPLLGIEAMDKFGDSSNLLNDEDGMYVLTVSGTGASFGKLLIGDIIVSVKVGTTVFFVEERNDFIFAMLHCKAGDTVNIGYVRGTSSGNVNITLM